MPVKLSKKAEYALRATVAIAKGPPGRPIPIQELAESEQIPLKFLEQILLSLKNGGFLESRRGVGGGYRLARPAGQISIGDLLTWIEGPFAPMEDASPGSGLGRCFAELQALFNDHLERHSLQDLVNMERDSDAMAFDI